LNRFKVPKITVVVVVQGAIHSYDTLKIHNKVSLQLLKHNLLGRHGVRRVAVESEKAHGVDGILVERAITTSAVRDLLPLLLSVRYGYRLGWYYNRTHP
jgi:hypothetical protein